MSTDAERMADVLAAHGLSGFVNSREGWVECLCDERLPCALDSDGYALDEDKWERALNEHRASALVAAGFGHVGEAKAEALREYADEIEWQRPEVSPCAPHFEECCGSEASCDAMRPVTRVVGAASLRDRADRIGGAQT